MTTLSLQDWGALGEVIGGVAVLFSLVYLAVQIRQNTKQISRSIQVTELDAFERNVASGNRFRELLILNPELSALLLRGLKSYDDLGGEEAFRFSMLMRNLFSEFHSVYIRQESLDSDPESFAGPRQLMDWFIAKPGVREWLNGSEQEPDWRPSFKAFVDERRAAFEQAQSD